MVCYGPLFMRLPARSSATDDCYRVLSVLTQVCTKLCTNLRAAILNEPGYPLGMDVSPNRA